MLASGPLPPNPSELLASERATEVIRSLAACYDVVLVDSPPVLPVTDAAIISAVADATILVINMGKSTRREISRTVEILHQVHATLIGTVLNGVSEDASDGYYRYSGYYYPTVSDKHVCLTGSDRPGRPKPVGHPPGTVRVLARPFQETHDRNTYHTPAQKVKSQPGPR